MISVCMATYEGEKFITRQLDSIVDQLAETDEIIIVDDQSKDNTVSLIKKRQDPRIKLQVNPSNLGPILSFEKAIQLAQGDYLFLADQDDIWFPNKVEKVMEVFKTEQAELVVHDAKVVDGDLEMIHPSWNHWNHNYIGPSMFRTIAKNGYTGCMMAFTKSLKDKIIPFPSMIEMHDQWIGMTAILQKCQIIELNEALMDYVRHGENATAIKKRSLSDKVKGRLCTLEALEIAKKRVN
ncbi:glycosyltransferase family 2 protein [Vagococcus humatus]|uniref:Alpha-L-Rha alpha-1,3-L-rhamnosyltransferase n=1 Tax=Vagococcus humatus TaxID=1889241 RepID=A0A429Z876_9ENTE|nr:glycosyltransferase family 2 protein [Vagococcus humatus]RST89891.1 alpha-L-Rha alpha-1,3-L-rhamnosyltransferase [Vagococcus humatus]